MDTDDEEATTSGDIELLEMQVALLVLLITTI